MAVDVEYARRGDISIAYQAIGEGPVDIIFGAGLVSHLDLMWADPYATAFLQKLSSLGRLLLFDKPGTGLSDPVAGIPTVDQRVEDYLAVMDAAGSRRAVVIGYSEAGAPAMLLAATHPDRVEALVVIAGFARFYPPDDLPDVRARFENTLLPLINHSTEHWGDGALMLAMSPHARENTLYRRLAPSVERASASPGMARVMLTAMRDYDVTSVVDTISVPTLVMHRRDDYVPVEYGRWIAANIPGAEYIELPGAEHMVYFVGDDVVEHLAAFLGRSSEPRPSTTRRLATVAFTDIVDSTSTASRLGDERWRSLLTTHDHALAEEVERHDGVLIKTTGDGLLASFDRPLLAVRSAVAMCRRASELGIDIRAGLHTGECEMADSDMSGVAVHIAARIMAMAGPGEVLVSSTVKDLVFGSGVEFEARGDHELKGLPDRWSVHAIARDRSRDQRPASQATAAEAALTPAASETMKRFDRALVGVASRAPRISRVGMRLFSKPRG